MMIRVSEDEMNRMIESAPLRTVFSFSFGSNGVFIDAEESPEAAAWLKNDRAMNEPVAIEQEGDDQ